MKISESCYQFFIVQIVLNENYKHNQDIFPKASDEFNCCPRKHKNKNKNIEILFNEIKTPENL